MSISEETIFSCILYTLGKWVYLFLGVHIYRSIYVGLLKTVKVRCAKELPMVRVEREDGSR